ncbi:MAG: ATP-grasp domain-containing protein [Komarekiella atlantica HA4396-MV6]|jgi:predicted ATP-grasp superfamily ATP-dependent carboligase|nr:ATP-grasp domain-containing protein [Komarekiella atlantica HA4396-MV6]
MKTKQISVLIPDQSNNPLAYYVVRCLKEGKHEFKINMIVASDQVSNNDSWSVFYNNTNFIDNLFFSKYEMNSSGYLNEVIQIIENAEVEIVVPASEAGFKFVSKYRDKLSKFCKVVALPSYDALDIAFDKWKLSLVLKQNNIPMPETVLLNSIEDASSLKYPVIIKPTNGSGGKNIQKFDAFSQDDFQSIIDNKSEVYIVQEYIDGYDIDCNVLCLEGQVIAYTIQQPLGVEGGFSPKIDKLRFVHNSSVIDIVSRTMNALKWSGVAHLDLRFDSKNGNFKVIEINPRFWQSLMGSLSVDVNFPYLLYLLTSEISFDTVSYQEKYYAKLPRFFKDALNGTLEYDLSDTNIKYLLSDINSVLRFSIHNFVRNKLYNKKKKFAKSL